MTLSGPSAAVAEPGPKGVPPWLAVAHTWPEASPKPFVSQHLGGDHLAVVRVSPAASSVYQGLGPDTQLPRDSVVVELLNGMSGKRGPTLALENSSGSWIFWVFGPDGSFQRSGPELAPCAGCHAAAPAPPLFGPPRD